MIGFEGQLQEWNWSSYLGMLSLQNAIGQLVSYFLIIENSDNYDYLSLKEIIRRGVLFKNLGLLNLLTAIAFTALVILSFFFKDFAKELSVAMTIILAAGFAIPYLIYYNMNEQQIENVAEFHGEFEEEQAELGVDHDFWELKDRTEPWLYAVTTFVVFGISRMICENAFLLSLGREAIGLQLVQAFKASELVGVCLAGLVLIFFRAYVTPAAMLILQAFVLLASQANMLNPDRESLQVPTMLLVTTCLAAVAEGGYLISLCCYIHEEYGQKQFGTILGYIMSAGALGLLAFD